MFITCGYRAQMIPRRPSSLFRSRWNALLWAAGVIVTTVTTVGFGPAASTPSNADMANASISNDSASNTGDDVPTDAMGQPISDADLKALAAVMNGT